MLHDLCHGGQQLGCTVTVIGILYNIMYVKIILYYTLSTLHVNLAMHACLVLLCNTGYGHCFDLVTKCVHLDTHTDDNNQPSSYSESLPMTQMFLFRG